MIVLLLAAAIAQASGTPTGAIRVRAIDKETGRPLARATVVLVRIDGEREVDSLEMPTDERGGLTFDALEPGRYRGAVTARQHLREPLGADDSAITVTGNQTVEITVAVPRARAVNVRVVDTFGDPLSHVAVQAIAQDGGGSSSSSFEHTTDDLGRLRIFDLPPGRYTLCAEGGSFGVPSDTPRGDRLLRTCYPSTDEAHAEAVRVGPSDVDGIEIQMRRGRTYTISGVVPGAPSPWKAGAVFSIVRFAADRTEGSRIALDADGRFRIVDVQPGRYAIQGWVSDLTQPPESRSETAAFAEVRVEDADVDGVVLALTNTVVVQGRIAPEDPGATLPDSDVTIKARLAGEHLPGSGSALTGDVTADRTFTIAGVFGRRMLDLSEVPRGWYVKSIRYDGKEIIDAATEFKGGRDAPALDVMLSNRGAIVTGTVVDGSGAPSRALVGMLRTTPADGSVAVAAWRETSRDGTFSIGPARGGDYVIVAVPASSDRARLSSQDRLSRLAALGERVTLTDVDERVMQLRITRER